MGRPDGCEVAQTRRADGHGILRGRPRPYLASSRYSRLKSIPGQEEGRAGDGMGHLGGPHHGLGLAGW